MFRLSKAHLSSPPPTTPAAPIQTSDPPLTSSLIAAQRLQHLEKESWKHLDKERLTCPICGQSGVKWTNKGPSGSPSATGTRRFSIRCDGSPSGSPCGHSGRLVTILLKQQDSDYLDIGNQIAAAHQQLEVLSRSDAATLRQPKPRPITPSTPHRPTSLLTTSPSILSHFSPSSQILTQSPQHPTSSTPPAITTSTPTHPTPSNTLHPQPNLQLTSPTITPSHTAHLIPLQDRLAEFSYRRSRDPLTTSTSKDTENTMSSSKKTLSTNTAATPAQPTDQAALLDQIYRMNLRLDSLLTEIKGLREDNSQLQKRLDDKDAEINRLTRNPSLLLAPTPKVPPPAVPTAPTPDMETEEGEVEEAIPATKLAAFKADLTKTVVAELLTAMKEAGLVTPSTAFTNQRRTPPKIFSENFDLNAPRTPGPMSFAAAVRQIARGDATPDHAARMVFRSTYPRSSIPGIVNVYMRGYAEPGPLRYTIIRNALLTLGITSGVLDMSFIGKSVVHLLCDASKASFIQERLTDKGVYLPNFDPLEVPELVVSSTKSKEERMKEGRLNCIKRLGGLYARGGQQIKLACLDGVDNDMADAIRTQAKIFAEEQSSAQATTPNPPDP
ncbi:hypothetical protein BC829DRAFT_423890 [Chytridium lagenaria]|nr:hypothetical protein BC829DRAFT_423890 [Chytridium lagenaria]